MLPHTERQAFCQRAVKVFGWGREGEGMTAAEEAFALGVHRRRFGVADFPSIRHPDARRYPPAAPAHHPAVRACADLLDRDL